MLMWTVCSVWYACIGVGSALNEVYLYWCGNMLLVMWVMFTMRSACCSVDVGGVFSEVHLC